MDDLSTIRSEALGAVAAAADLAALEAARVAVLGKKGSITGLMKTLGGLAPDQRKEFGARVNQLKGEIEANYPIYRAPPPLDDARPNETTWTVVTKAVDAKRAQRPTN